MVNNANHTGKIDIKSLEKAQLITVLENLGEKKFRATQIFEWLYKQHVSSFDDMNNLSKSLREQLKSHFKLPSAQIITMQESKDDTRKYLISFSDNVCVEAVGIPNKNNLTVCFSTQAGCAMGCIFCATGQHGFTRNLTCGEMFDQIFLVGQNFGMRVSNVVAMGQGEPFLNYEAMLQVLHLINNEKYLNIGARHITVSSCGLLNGIEKFSKEPEQFTLAISLHSAIQEKRAMLMPGVAHVDLSELKNTLKMYGDNTKRRPSLEYVLIQNINDGEEDLDALINFSHGMLCHVNLIPLNTTKKDSSACRDTKINTANGNLKISPNKANAKNASETISLLPSKSINHFKHALQSHGIEVSIRNSRGADIDGACGQLHQRVFN